MSKQRDIINGIIKSSKEHMSAEEVYKEAKKALPSIAMGTVYRNLGLMADVGDIRRIVMMNAPDRFDRTLEPHEHLVCQNCGELHDVFLPDFKDYLEKKIDMEIIRYDLNIKYICQDCMKEKGR